MKLSKICIITFIFVFLFVLLFSLIFCKKNMYKEGFISVPKKIKEYYRPFERKFRNTYENMSKSSSHFFRKLKLF